MGAPINTDLRQAAVGAYCRGNDSYEFIAALFAVGIASLKRWVRRYRKTGSVAPDPQKHGPDPKIDDRGLRVLKGLCDERCDRTLLDLQELYNRGRRQPVSISTIGRAVRERLGLLRKKKSYRPEQQDTPRVQKLRREFGEMVADALADGRRLVFVDESGCQLGMDRGYGRAEAGQRAHCTKPFHRGLNVNLIGAIGVTSVRCMMVVDGSVDGDVLEAFARDVLGPRLRADDVVIWDNLSAHKVQRVTEAIADRGAAIIPLPPYSPDLNPIEMMWSKLKEGIRRHAPRTMRQFNRALKLALQSITRSDLRNWFRHCSAVTEPV